MSAIMTSRQAAELDHAFERNGWTAEDVKWLSSNEILAQLLCVRWGLGEIKKVKHIINLAKPPRLPFRNAVLVKHDSKINGKSVVKIELRSDDNLYLDGKKIVLHLSKRQMGEKVVKGHELREELESGELVLLNSNVLDYIYDHPELFPEHWKKDENGGTRFIFFWGSIFQRRSEVDLYIHSAYWSDDHLECDYACLDYNWFHDNPSVSLAS